MPNELIKGKIREKNPDLFPDLISPERKYIMVTSDYCGLGFAIQQLKQGSEVLVAFKSKKPEETEKEQEAFDNLGEGLVDKIHLDDLMEDRESYRDWYWIWDFNCNWKENELLRSEGFKVFGGSKFCYDMENDREFGIAFAESCGLVSPEYQEFKSVEDGVKFLEQNEDKAYVFKPNEASECYLTTVISDEDDRNANLELREFINSMNITDYILQEKVKGIEVNLECFYQNGTPVFAQVNLEDKKEANGDLGENTGCAFDLCWTVDVDSELIKQTIGKMHDKLSAINYTGFADANVIVGDDKIYFLEYCFRMGYNAHPNLFFTLSKKTMFDTCADLIDGIYVPDFKNGFGASLTLFISHPHKGLPMYVPESAWKNFYLLDGYAEEEQLKLGGYSKEIGIVLYHDYTPEFAFEGCIHIAEKIKYSNKRYRTDPCKTDFPNSIIRRFHALGSLAKNNFILTKTASL